MMRIIFYHVLGALQQKSAEMPVRGKPGISLSNVIINCNEHHLSYLNYSHRSIEMSEVMYGRHSVTFVNIER